MEITRENNIRDIERFCNNYFNPQNDPACPDRDHPPEFLEMVDRIFEWRTETPVTGYTFEMVVGLHQYSTATTEKGMPVGWREVFAGELAAWKRVKFL